MKRITFLLFLTVAAGGPVSAGPAATNRFGENRTLLIEPSSMPLPAGAATLTIGVLERTNGIYAGDYRVKVFPYFYKSEKGRLAMVVSDGALANIRAGKATAITGTATTSGQRGRCRRIEAMVTPNGRDQGRLKVLFLAGSREMIFEPVYHLVNTAPSPALRPVPRATLPAATGGHPSGATATDNTGPTAVLHL